MELNAEIAARSERQAMDWSLVLVSQGIETAIDAGPVGGAWRLRVAERDLGRSRAVLRQYWRENRRRRWQRPVSGTGLLFDGRSVFWFLLMLAVFFLDETGVADLKAAGMMDTAAVKAGEVWRLFTAVTLHADAGHLAGNAATGVLLLGLAMGCYGGGCGLLAAFLAGVGGNALALVLAPWGHRSLGASGMVLGALGLLTVHSLGQWRAGASTRQMAGRGLMAGVMLLVLLGFNPKTDVLGHVGGFASGCVLGMALAWIPERIRERGQALSAAACGALVAAAWAWAAFHGAR